MNLEDGNLYVDGHGTKVLIGGTCAAHPEWCWSIAGFWYVRATGEHLTYGKVDGAWCHYVNPQEMYHLSEELQA
jgi:hypothetical protein